LRSIVAVEESNAGQQPRLDVEYLLFTAPTPSMSEQHLSRRSHDDHSPDRTPADRPASVPAISTDRRATRSPFTPAALPPSETSIPQADGHN
jgi:hypothetical protein